jgi:hypothetical protein
MEVESEDWQAQQDIQLKGVESLALDNLKLGVI